MKKIFILISMLLFSAASFSQQLGTGTSAAKTNYLKKSKHLQTAATIVLLSGSVLVATPLIISSGHHNGESSGDATMAIVYGSITAGFVCLPVSIGLFIAASSKKKKAMRLSFKNEAAPVLSNRGFAYHYVPSFNLKISL